ncbi:hypothetical protein [Chitinilyticum piscinae]|uniref:Uncharacterized protein n=1 Tax=Chitinilyticum piscinae TaxID=2866724 RepID=A0A8J7KGM4_9NEIS|nr:hypothetical protein [Chitinilyticum piscinae]MBE9610524.1 hypothetical protein [Chitinilyticum piscinae]
MYDCHFSDTTISNDAHPVIRPHRPASTSLPATPGFRRARLTLAAPAGLAALQLNKAFAAASSLGLALVQHDNGQIDVLDLGLEEALLFARRFPELLVRYEPARPWVR